MLSSSAASQGASSRTAARSICIVGTNSNTGRMRLASRSKSCAAIFCDRAQGTIPACLALIESRLRKSRTGEEPRWEALMRNFAEAAFEPEAIEAMSAALEGAIAKLPEPVSLSHVNQLAESILRTAKAGERDAAVLERIALLELQITPRE